MADETKRFMAMKGAGYYSKATTGARDAINGATPLVIEAIRKMRLNHGDSSVFRAVDMGAADGGTSLEMWGKVLTEIRAQAPLRPIELVYTDLPRNDFSQLFKIVHGQTDLESYLTEIDNVYVLASGTSFHEAILPAGTLDLGFSATASHYVSQTPCQITNHVHMVGAAGREREAFVEQGRKDWERMLLQRVKELKPGGRLVLFNFGIDEEGRYLGNTGGVNMFNTFEEIWYELAVEGVTSRDEYLATNFPQVYRTTAEFVAPLKAPSSSVYQAGLRLEHVESRVVKCPYAGEFASHRDAKRFARDYIPTLRSWSEPTFAQGLAGDRSAQEKQAILDEFYGRYERRVARSPHGHGMDYVHIDLICAKV